MALAQIAAALGLVIVSTASQAAAQIVKTQTGELEGTENNGVALFAGVPYAKPPVGDLRWRAPQEPERWNGTRRANEFGPDCMQRVSGPAVSARRMSEDCLYLNIWAPASRYATKLPVMVWIHGGAFRVGSGSQPMYDGTSFAYRGVVLVTINYRLDKLGFFAHPALANEDPDGPQANYGLQDQIAALKWIRDNISAFGGDARNITIFGESAGGMSVNYLMISPETKGLFHRAIVESGAFRFPTGSVQEAQISGQAAARSWGVTSSSAVALRGVAAEKIVASSTDEGRIGPVIDRRIVPEDVKTAFEAGRVMRVPYLIGSNSYEAGFFPDWADGLSDTLAGQWTRIEAMYDGYGTRQKPAIEGQLATDIMATAATREIARAAARNGLRTYVYHFSYLRPSQRGRVHGAMHVDEVYAVFDMMQLVEPQASLPEVRRVVADVQARWVQFAKTGRPTSDDDEWPTFRPNEERVLEFANDGPVVRLNFAQDRLDLADALTSAAVSRMASK